jgi:arylsulfatase
VYKRQAVSYIGDHLANKSDSPFFMYVAYTAPHWPMHAKAGDIEKYKGRFDSGWDELRKDKLERLQRLGLIDPQWDIETDRTIAVPWSEIENTGWELNRMEVYAAMVDCMDQGIGRIIAKLEEEGILDNTLVLFLSDNGACAEEWGPDNPWAMNFGPEITRDGSIIDYSNDGRKMAGTPDTYYSYGRSWAHYSNTPFYGSKSSTWEGGISTPFIVHWPARVNPDGHKREQIAGIIDIMPTILDVTGAIYPQEHRGNAIIPFEGINLMPAILQNTAIEREYYYVEHIGRNGIISDNGWKAVKIGKNPWQLFNNRTDRTETRPLENEMPGITGELAAEWQRWADRSYVLSSDSLEAIRKRQEKEKE